MSGIGEMLVNAVADLDRPLRLLLSTVCYILALIAFLQGCFRLLKYNEDKFHAPSISGTVVSFLISFVLIALPRVVEAGGQTFFQGDSPVSVSLGYGARAADYDRMLGAVLTIVELVGLLAVIKGIYVLRAASDGAGGATAVGAAMHMVGGLMLWHIAWLLLAVQTTLGIAVLRIS